MNRVAEHLTPTSVDEQDNETVVQFNLDPLLQNGCEVLSKHTVMGDGRIVALELVAAITTDYGPIEVEIKPMIDKWSRDVFLRTTTRNISHTIGHKDNTTKKGGVIEMEPFEVFRREARSGFADYASLKTSIALIYALFAAWMQYPIFSTIAIFTVITWLDWAVSMFPGALPVGKKRIATTLSRFYQWGAAIFVVAGLLLIQKLAFDMHAGGIGGLVAKFLPNYAMGLVIIIYGFRMTTSLGRLVYGDRYSKVKKKLAGYVPKKLQPLFKDDDFIAD